jgi:hypothetical protein
MADEPAPIEPTPDTPEPAVDDYSAARLALLIKAARETRKLKNVAVKDKFRAKASKIAWELSLACLHEMTLTSEQRPFVLGEDPDATEPDPDEAAETPDVEPTVVKAKPFVPDRVEGDDWKTVPLNHLGINVELHTSILKAFGDANLFTVGDLAKWSQPRPQGKGKRLIDIDAIGQSKADAIERALEEFWALRAEKGDTDVSL